MKTKIYVNYHKPAQIIPRTDVFVPIHVGKANSKFTLQMLDDAQGDNISHLNNSFCELTGQYWVWKNADPVDYVGFVHYRRFFDFTDSHQDRVNIHGIISEPRITIDFIRRYGLNDVTMSDAVQGYDIVLPKKWSVKNIGCKNIKQHYDNAPSHHAKDLEILSKIIRTDYSDYWPYLSQTLQDDQAYFTNMFIMKQKLFNEYSEWLFDVLGKVQQHLSLDSYDVAEQRVYGYLSERLLGVFVEKKSAENSNIKLKLLDRVFVENTDSIELYPTINDSADNITIASVADNNYAPHLGAMIVSILDNIKNTRHVDLIILDGGISEQNRFEFRKLINTRLNTTIHFVLLEDAFSDLPVNTYFSKSTFFRIILPELLPNVKKILYLDSDTIVLGDVTELFDIDLQDKALAAVPDVIMEHFVNSGVRSWDKTGSLPAKKYLTDYLGLKDSWDKYFQAGVLVFNLDHLRKKGFSQRLISLLKSKPYWFLDQDALNIELSVNYVPIEYDWNVVNTSRVVMPSLEKHKQDKLNAAFLAPKLVHYAGFDAKPWNNPSVEFSGNYWQYLRRTVWYEQVMMQSPKTDTVGVVALSTPTNLLWRMAFKTWMSLPFGVRRYLQSLKKIVRKVIG